MSNSVHLRAAASVVLAIAALAGCSNSSSTSPLSGTSTSPAVAKATPGEAFPAVPKHKAFIATLVTDVGGLNDRSYNELAWKGLRAAERRYGITIVAVESKKPSQYLHNLVRAAQHYSTLTIAVGYGMARAVYTAALEFPKARFAIVDGRPLDVSGRETTLQNVSNLLFKEQESGYAVGVIAGLLEKRHVGRATHNTIGYLGGQDIAPVNNYLAGYVAGAHSVDPTVHVVGGYARSFTNTALGVRIATRQIAQGADILFQVAAETGVGYLAAAQQHGLYGIGADTDQHYLGPSIITSAVKNASVAVFRETAATLHGAFRGGDNRLGAADGATGFAPVTSMVPASVAAQAAAALHQIALGKVSPPTSIPGR